MWQIQHCISNTGKMARKVSVGVIIYIITRLAIDSCSAQEWDVLGVQMKAFRVMRELQIEDTPDTLTDTGFYICYGGMQSQGWPLNGGFYLEVYKFNSSFWMQRLTDRADNKIYIRNKWSTVITSWRTI